MQAEHDDKLVWGETNLRTTFGEQEVFPKGSMMRPKAATGLTFICCMGNRLTAHTHISLFDIQSRTRLWGIFEASFQFESECQDVSLNDLSSGWSLVYDMLFQVISKSAYHDFSA
jgi:hypothetical protein